MIDDGVIRLQVLEFLRAEQKRGFLWNLTDTLGPHSQYDLPVQPEITHIFKPCVDARYCTVRAQIPGCHERSPRELTVKLSALHIYKHIEHYE